MIKIYIRTMLFMTALFVSGCGVDGDTCAAKVSIDLDEESFTKVVNALENNQTCSGSLSKEEAWLDLGAAYIGQAGVSVGKILGSIAGLKDAKGLGAILSTFDSASNTVGLQALSNAKVVYGYLLDGVTCGSAGVTTYQEAACTYLPIAETLKTVGVLNATMGSVISLIGKPVTTGGELDVDGGGSLDETQATKCAILTNANSCTSDGNVTVTSSADKTFTNTTQNFSATYTPAKYVISNAGGNPTTGPDYVDAESGNTYYKLIDATNGPITTNGKCTNTFVACDTIDNSSCFACPVLVDGATISTTSGILDTVNSDSTDPSVKKSLDGADGSTPDGTVSSAELAAGMAQF